jgi:hypothetical protein
MGFSGITGTAAGQYWHSNIVNNTWHWVQIEFTEAKTANWGIFSMNMSSYDPRGFYIMGSNDGVTWSEVHGTSGYFDLNKAYKFGNDLSNIPVAFDRPGSYTHYRFHFYAMNNYIAAYNIQLFDSPNTNINRITSEDPFTFYTAGAPNGGMGANNLAHVATNYVPVSADYPKGYKAFYVMKHELTQAAYADFLNCLAWDQQLRLALGVNPSSAVGTALPPATSRMNIKIRERGIDGPAVFGISTKTAGWGEDETDWDHEIHGGNIPMFNLAWTDISAYLDWAALRPMTELEYEKAARGTVKRMYNEYAWGQPFLPSRVANVENRNLPDENPIPDVANYSQPEGGSVAGHSAAIMAYWPVRAGSFARSETTREEAGATYWGILNFSDNVPERVININTGAGRAFTGEHGDGNLTANGFSNVVNWPAQTAGIAVNNAAAVGTGYRGIDVSSTTIYVPRQVSYRGGIEAANYNQNHRDLWTGLRGVRTEQK